MIKVGVLGAKGRMGSEVVKAVNAASDMQLQRSCQVTHLRFRVAATPVTSTMRTQKGEAA